MVEGRWKCENCGNRFDREKSGKRPIRFCSQTCYHKWAKNNSAYRGTFPKKHEPWNKDVKGIHLSPKSEYKKGRDSEKWLPVGSETIRQHHHEKNERVWVKVAEPSVWKLRAVYNWEAQNGSVPKGSVVHHKDRDSLNDSLDNLQVMTRAEHINEHRYDRKESLL